MQISNSQKYCMMMLEIKDRLRISKEVGEGNITTFTQRTRVEFVYLQFRKVIELIAMSSLLANENVLSQVQSNIQNYWKAKNLLKDIEEKNPNFYPKPIIKKPSKKTGIKEDWIDRPNDYLTKERFITLYDKCGSILHVKNPFTPELDIEKLEKACPKWYLQIINLLNSHIIRLIGDNNLYLIQMGKDMSQPTCSIFAPYNLNKKK